MLDLEGLGLLVLVGGHGDELRLVELHLADLRLVAVDGEEGGGGGGLVQLVDGDDRDVLVHGVEEDLNLFVMFD